MHKAHDHHVLRASADDGQAYDMAWRPRGYGTNEILRTRNDTIIDAYDDVVLHDASRRCRAVFAYLEHISARCRLTPQRMLGGYVAKFQADPWAAVGQCRPLPRDARAREQREKRAARGIGTTIALREERGDVGAAERFDEALAADFARWPFQRARLLLAYGRWLRRERRVAESRPPLRSAREIFDTLGCGSWADQVRRELRASGESSRRRDPSLRDQLTAQELQIAQLAADGLSNREIGQKLYVSPRTVSTHLYRIYPKLQVSARSELAPILSGVPN